ncbi:MAG: M3 family oligoendopeptidase, partial [Rhodospirillales bacterium]|nr:M3 family oligoendopeptidase [Rhodospirillales bacterium]
MTREQTSVQYTTSPSDTATAQASTEDSLPSWDLSDLYNAPDAPEITSDLARVTKGVAEFSAAHKGKIVDISPPQFAQAIVAYEGLMETLYRVGSYAQLLYAANVSDPEVGQFYQTIHEKVTDISTDTLFFTLEINRLEDQALKHLLTDDGVAHYAPWLRDVRMFRDHELSDELEQALHQKSVTGRSAWSRLFDEAMADMRITIDGEELTLADTLNRLSDTDGMVRKAAAKALGHQLTGQVRLFSLITNTLAKDKEIEDRLRQYASPMASRNLANQVEDDVVTALVTSVKAAYPDLSHRYYALKAKWFGVEKLDYWDRNAPLPDQADRHFSWDQARTTVLDAYGRFEPELADIAGGFFERNWIDAALRPGKDSGAFSHPTVPSVHPYILMNYHGRSRDVMTLAHELGHGVHQVLSGPRGGLMSDTPLTLAETASVFGEMLTFQFMLENETSAEMRRVMIAGKVEDMMNTVVRQVAFHEFERVVHDERRSGELTADRLGEVWMQIQRESLGPAIRFDDDYRHYWAYIPHFIHSPFYV